MNAEWAMVIVTIAYVIMTAIICVFNWKSVCASNKQIEEMQKQFEVNCRLQTIPFLQVEMPNGEPQPCFEIPLSESDSTDIRRSIMKLRNIGNGLASNIVYSWRIGEKTGNGYPPINAIMKGDSCCFSFVFSADEYLNSDYSGYMTWEFTDLLGNSYQQKTFMYFEGPSTLRFENDPPKFLGFAYYEKERCKDI